MTGDQPLQTKPAKWYLTVWAVVIWLSILGPLALPLVWKSPKFNLFWKWAITVLTVVATVFFVWSTWRVIALVIQEFEKVKAITSF